MQGATTHPIDAEVDMTCDGIVGIPDYFFFGGYGKPLGPSGCPVSGSCP